MCVGVNIYAGTCVCTKQTRRCLEVRILGREVDGLGRGILNLVKYYCGFVEDKSDKFCRIKGAPTPVAVNPSMDKHRLKKFSIKNLGIDEKDSRARLSSLGLGIRCCQNPKKPAEIDCLRTLSGCGNHEATTERKK